MASPLPRSGRASVEGQRDLFSWRGAEPAGVGALGPPQGSAALRSRAQEGQRMLRPRHMLRWMPQHGTSCTAQHSTAQHAHVEDGGAVPAEHGLVFVVGVCHVLGGAGGAGGRAGGRDRRGESGRRVGGRAAARLLLSPFLSALLLVELCWPGPAPQTCQGPRLCTPQCRVA